MSKKSFQEWSYVAQRAGVSTSALETAMKRLTKDNKSFDKTIKELQNMDNAAERNAKAFELFGKNAAELYPILNMTDEQTESLRKKANSLGGILSATVVKSAVQLKDSITDMQTALKGLLGVLGEKLLPIIRQAVEWLTQLIVRAQQFFKIVFGIENKVESVDISKGMEDYSDATEDAIDETKKLITLIGGFDELNVLNSKDDNKNGSGTSNYEFDIPGLSDGIDKSQLDFELPEGWKRTAEWIKDHLDEILKTVELIGIGIAAWKISSALMSGLKDLSTFKMEAGITLAIVGLTLSWEGAYGIGYNGINKEDLLTMLIGNLGLIAGLTLAFGPTGLIIGLIASMTIDIVGMIVGHNKKVEDIYKNSELGKRIEALKEKLEKQALDNLELKAHIKSITGNIDNDLMSKFNELKSLVDEVFNIDSKENKTAQEIQKIKDLCDLINQTKLLPFQLQYDESTKHINMTKDAVQGVIDNLLKQYKTEALKESIIELYKDELKAAEQVKEAQDNYTESRKVWSDAVKESTIAENEYNKAMQEFNEYTNYGMSLTAPFTEKFWELNQAVNDARDKFEATKLAVKNATEQVDIAKKQLDNAKTAADDCARKIDLLRQKLDGINGKRVVVDIVENYTQTNTGNANSFGGIIDKPGIQKYAVGGVVNKPTIAMVGEYSGASSNPEIITPENKMRDIFNESNNALGEIFVQVGRQIVQAIQEQDNSVVIGDDAIARAASRGNKAYQMRTGMSLI